MSALGMGESNSGEPAQPLYANAAEDTTNANNRTSADRENNSIPVSFRADAVTRFLRISVQSLCTETEKASAPLHFHTLSPIFFNPCRDIDGTNKFWVVMKSKFVIVGLVNAIGIAFVCCLLI